MSVRSDIFPSQNFKPVQLVATLLNKSHFIICLIAGYYLTPRKIFKTLDDLVSHHSQKADGLCCRLTIARPNLEASPAAVEGCSKDGWETDSTTVSFIRKLSRGGKVKEVWEGVWKCTTSVAIKTVPKPVGLVATEEFLAEAHVLMNLRDANIIRLYAICSKCQPAYILTEFMKNGNLLDYLKTGEGRNMNHHVLAEIATQVASGMFYLETHGCIHRDLRARNVLVGKKKQVKIANFGMAKVLKGDAKDHALPEYQVVKDEVLPIRWTAPEVFLNFRHTIKSDVWSFGVLLTELVTYGEEPYSGMSELEVKERVIMGYRMPEPAGCPSHLYHMMWKCWEESPLGRPTFDFLRYLDDYALNEDHVYLHDPSSILNQ